MKNFHMILYDQCSSLVFKQIILWSRWSMLSTMLALLVAGHFSCLALASEGGEKIPQVLLLSVVFQHPRWHEQYSKPWVVMLYSVLYCTARLYRDDNKPHKFMKGLQITRTILMLQMFARVLQDSSLWQFPNVDVAYFWDSCCNDGSDLGQVNIELMSPTHAEILSMVQLSI